MFTGIIQTTGTASRSGAAISIRSRAPLLRRLKIGGSIAVDGVCLTVVAKKGNAFTADVMRETATRTTLGGIEDGAEVNLELPATPTSFLSGHIVQGHVDGVATLESIERHGTSRLLTFRISSKLARYLVEKGSIAVSGVALTVIQASKTRFSVGIIPHTWEKTSLHRLHPGGKANIEVDVLAKYIEKLV